MTLLLPSRLVVRALRLKVDVSNVAGAANAIMVHWREQRRRGSKFGIASVQDSFRVIDPTYTLFGGFQSRPERRYAWFLRAFGTVAVASDKR